MSNLIATENNIRTLVCKDPFSLKKVEYFVGEGVSIFDIVVSLKIPAYLDVVVYVNDDIIKKADWKKTFPKKNDLVVFRSVPMGDGDNLLRTILSVVVLVVASYIAGPAGAALSGATGLSVAASEAIVFGIASTIGMLAINAIAPPYTPPVASSSYDASNSYSISNARNSYNNYGPIPSVLGKIRCVPPYAALSYTESEGNLQALYCSFNIGKGPVLIEDQKIGETKLSELGSEEELECDIHNGFEDRISKIYYKDVYPEGLSAAIKQEYGWVVKTTQPNTTRIGIDLTLQRGLGEINDKGNVINKEVKLEIQYALKDSENWIGPESGTGTFIEARTADISNVEGYNNTTIVWGLPQVWIVVIEKISGRIRFINSEVYTTDVPSWAHGLAVVIFNGPFLGPAAVLDDIRTPEVAAWGFEVTAAYTSKINDNFDSFKFNVDVASGVINVDSYFNITGQTKEPVFRSFYFPVPDGQYDVRVRRVTADSDSTRVFDEITWTMLRSYQVGSPILEPNLAHTDLKVNATDKLNGVIDQYNCIGTTICSDYDISTDQWIIRATNNPASLFRHVLQGPANKRPLSDSQIDIETLEVFHERCRLNGWTFNHYVDYRTSVEELLKMIASAGRASKGSVDGKYSVIMDRVQTNHTQTFSPRNTWDYSYSKTFVDHPHAYRVRFLNEDKGYYEDEIIVCDDGYSVDGTTPGTVAATKFEELSLPGITKSNLAWSHARYHMATARLRPEKHTWFCDVENLLCTRGDWVKFNNDVIGVGLGSGRIKNYSHDDTNVITVTVDEVWTMEEGKTYGIRVRQNDNTSLVIALVTVPGASSTFFLSSVLSVQNAPDEGALALFGETDKEAIDLIVTSILPGSNLTAQLTGIAYAPEVHNADVGPIPDFDSGITEQYDPSKIAPGIPYIANIESGIRAMELSGDSRRYRIFVTIDPPLSTRVAIQKYVIRWRLATGLSSWQSISTEADNPFLIINDVQVGMQYEIQARSVGFNNVASEWCASDFEIVTGDLIQEVYSIRCPATGTTTWTSKDLDIAWVNPDVLSLVGSRVEIISLDETQILRRISRGKNEQSYNYTYDQNVQDYGGASPTVKMRVVAIDLNNDEAASPIVTFSNPAPSIVTGLVTSAGSTDQFIGKDVDVKWSAPVDNDLTGFEVSVSHGAATLRTEVVTSPNYRYTYEMNMEDGAGVPHNSVVIIIRSIDAFSQYSGQVTGTFTNPAPAMPNSLSQSPWMGGIQFTWIGGTIDDQDFLCWRYRIQVGSEDWDDWIKTETPRVNSFLSQAQYDAYPGGVEIFIEVVAVDTFGTESAVAALSGITGSLSIPVTSLDDFADISAAFYETPVLRNFTWTSNSPGAGRIAWSAGDLYYNGTKYPITSGSTGVHAAGTPSILVYWTPTAGTFSATSGEVPAGAFIMASNVAGVANVAWNNAAANQVIGSAWMRYASIVEAHIGNLQVTDAKIVSLHGAKILAGTLTVDGFNAETQDAILNENVIPSNNLCPNGNFTAGISGWGFGSYQINITSLTANINFNPDWTLRGANTAYIEQIGRSGVAGAYAQIAVTTGIVVPGKRYSLSVYTGAHRCKVKAQVAFYTSAGSLIVSSFSTDENDSESAGGISLAGYKRLSTFVTAPANSAYAFIALMKYDTNLGETNSYAFYADVMFSEVTATQTSIPSAYSYYLPPYLRANDIPDNSINMNGTFLGFHSTGSNWPIRIHNDNGVGKFYVGNAAGDRYINFDGSSLYMKLNQLLVDTASGIIITGSGSLQVNTGGGIYVTGAGNIVVDQGGDVILRGSDTDPGKVHFLATDTARFVEMGGSSDLTNFYLSPSAEDVIDLYVGSSFRAQTNYRFKNVFLNAVDKCEMNCVDVALGRSNYVQVGPGSVTFRSDNGSPFTMVLLSALATFSPGNHKVLNLGTASTAWDTAYADDWTNVADIPFLDEVLVKGERIMVNDVEVIQSIKPSRRVDPLTGMTIINDSTIPTWLVVKHKRDGEECVEVEKDELEDWEPKGHQHWVSPGDRIRSWKVGEVATGPDGRPYYSSRTMDGLIMGALRAIDKRVKLIEERKL